MSAAIINSDLAKVRRDLEDCRGALSAWYGIGDMPSATDENTHRAIEALVRAVSSLTLAVDRLAAAIVTTP